MKINNKGFTIVELLVTIGFIAILVILSVTMGRSALQRSSFTAAINQFVADFSYARQLASRENRYVAIVINPGGTAYTIRIQRKIGLDLSNPNNYMDDKTVEPLEGEQFFSSASSFAVNSVGVIRAYPVNVNASPITVTLTCVKKRMSGEIDYKRTLTIFPSGGIKIENTK